MIDSLGFDLFVAQLQEIADEIVLAYHKLLAEKDKIATGKTKKSIREEVDARELSISIFGAEGMKQIEEGREAYTVLLEDDDPDLLVPIKKIG